MKYSLNILRQLGEEQDKRLSEEDIMKEVASPLMLRVVKNRVAPQQVMEVLGVILGYVDKTPGAGRYLYAKSGGVLHCLAKYWSTKGAATNVLVNGILHDVQQLQKASQRWLCAVFTAMNFTEATQLLKRLMRTGNFLSLKNRQSICDHPAQPGGDIADPELLKTYLMSKQQSGSVPKVRQGVHDLQEKSSMCKDQGDRAFYAKSALLRAIATGSLSIFHEALRWSRRLIRDPLTAKEIYHSDSVAAGGGTALLSGIPEDIPDHPTDDMARWQIKEANDIFKEFFSIACLALSEPSFCAADWYGFKRVIALAVEKRIRLTQILQSRYGYSDEIIYERVWKDTIVTLIELERSICMPENWRLNFCSPYGLVGSDVALFGLFYRLVGSDASLFAVSYRFLDELASARDKLWREIRPMTHPAAASFEQPWPRGFPIQCLIGGYNFATEGARGFTPFLSSRASSILFMDTSIALAPSPDDQEIKEAIGGFVESFKTALQIFVLQQPEGSIRNQSILKIWDHVMAQARCRMSISEAILTLRSIFQEALPSTNLELPLIEEESQDYPTFPQSTGEDEIVEWNPAYSQPQPIESRRLPPTIIDCFIAANYTTSGVHQSFLLPKPRTTQFEPTGVWRIGSNKRESANVQEGLIALALLWIDSQENRSTRILSKHFPSISNIRYPPMILDSDFLLSLGQQQLTCCESWLIRHRLHYFSNQQMVSSDSLSRLESSSTNFLDAPDTAYHLLILITKSYRPQVASELILRTIIDQPEASSWHRHVLSLPLLLRLAPHDAKGVLESLTEVIVAKLDAQQISAAKSKTPEAPVVKATTIKYIAQLLRDVEFISYEASVDILITLLQKSSHPDVQYAIFESLLAMLTRHASSNTHAVPAKILSALKVTISIISRFNERQALPDKDISTLGMNEMLPVIEDNNDLLPPMFSLLLQFVSSPKVPPQLRQDLSREILLPVLENLKAFHNQWTSLFLKTSEASSVMDSVPSMPPQPAMLTAMLRSIPAFVPKEYFEAWHLFTTASITPDPRLSLLDRTLADLIINGDEDRDDQVQDTRAYRHWLSLYQQGRGIFQKFKLTDLLWHDLDRFEGSKSPDVAIVQRLVLEQAEMLTRGYPEWHHVWEAFLKPLLPPRLDSLTFLKWKDITKPVLQGIVKGIEAHRYGRFKGIGSDRRPSFLPHTFGLRPELLYTESWEEKHSNLAEEVMNLLRQLLNSNKPYHHELKQIQNDFSSKLSAPEKLALACSIGTLSSLQTSEPAVIDYLRVEIAYEFLRETSATTTDIASLVDRRDGMLVQWKESGVEDFRMKAAFISESLLRA
ncbi:MAG: hypothetical protein Q9222_002714 [Ikaeria aurantiellina]